MQGVRKVGGKPSLEVLTYRLRNLQASSGTYASSLRLALLATRVLTGLVSLCFGVMLLTSAVGHHPVLSRALAVLHKFDDTDTSHLHKGAGAVTVWKILIAAWAFLTCATSLISAMIGVYPNRQERPCNTTDCGGPYACTYSFNYGMGCVWVLITLGVYCSQSLQWPASAFSLVHFYMSAVVCTLLSVSAVLVDLLKYAGMNGVATQPSSMAV